MMNIEQEIKNQRDRGRGCDEGNITIKYKLSRAHMERENFIIIPPH